MWCFVVTWIVQLYRRGYELFRVALAIPGLDLAPYTVVRSA